MFDVITVSTPNLSWKNLVLTIIAKKTTVDAAKYIP